MLTSSNDFRFNETAIFDGRLTLKKGGSVGINTANPSASLDVVGDVKASSQISTWQPAQTLEFHFFLPFHWNTDIYRTGRNFFLPKANFNQGYQNCNLITNSIVCGLTNTSARPAIAANSIFFMYSSVLNAFRHPSAMGDKSFFFDCIEQQRCFSPPQMRWKQLHF
jgi:hypothetical protein